MIYMGQIDSVLYIFRIKRYNRCIDPILSAQQIRIYGGVVMIKSINTDDIPCCVEVIRKSFDTVANDFGLTEENAARFTAFATTVERLNLQLNNEHRPMYAYFDGDTIIGYYSLLLQGNAECELNNLCVLPAYRHKKLGGLLLEDAFDKAKKLNCKKMNIGIVEENITLRKWYEYYGFVHTGTQKFEFFPFTCGYMSKEL